MNFLLRPSQNGAAAVSPTPSGTPLSVTPPSSTPPSGTTPSGTPRSGITPSGTPRFGMTPSGTPRSGTPLLSKTIPRALLLDGVIAADRSSVADYSSEDQSESFGNETEIGATMSPTSFMKYAPFADKHIDVLEDEGSITIPSRQLPDDWCSASDMRWFRSFDRSFVFPGEQVYIVACLSGSHQDSEIITPFKVAAVMNKSGGKQTGKDENENLVNQGSSSETQQVGHNDQENSKSGSGHQVDVSASESILRKANHRRQIQKLLQRFKDSHFFIRIAESREPLWSKIRKRVVSEKGDPAGLGTSITAVIDSGRFDSQASGGVARDSIKCSSLANGDIVVLLQVNVGADYLKDPVLEILQFEKHQERIRALDTDVSSPQHSPCGELLKWLLPLNNSPVPISQPSSSLVKSSLSASTSSQRFSFGSFRSNSLSPLPPSLTPVPSSPVSSVSKPNFELDEWDNFASQKFAKNLKTGNQGLFSYRGMSLEPERFSVCCGLEGIYIPGRRWRKRLQIICPVDILTFGADCNTDDLLCVQIKNVSPTHIPDIVVYVDTITIVLEEASKVGPPSSVPIACIEAGTDHSLPNLALRRGEEHSFILKPDTSSLKTSIPGDKFNKLFQPKASSRAAGLTLPPKSCEGERNLSSDKYAVLVSCRSNCSESRLFFKKPTNWRPCLSRDLLISVASEISKQTLDHTGGVSHLLVQASNLTSEDLNMMILAPASFTTPFVLSLNSPPSSPSVSPFSGFATTQKLSSVAHFADYQNHDADESLSVAEPGVTVSDLIPTTALNYTHLWLQSRIPLGCVPSQSTATIKLELLPLTDGIITLDTLQIYVKEKGKAYVPEHAPKINATSSIATGMM